MTNQNSTEQPLRFQVFYTGGPHTVPEWYLCSEWASQQAADDYCSQMAHFNAGSCFAVIDLWGMNIKHEARCAHDCGAEENGVQLAPDPTTNEWYAYYPHDTVDEATGHYGLSFQCLAGPAPSESSLQALMAVLRRKAKVYGWFTLADEEANEQEVA